MSGLGVSVRGVGAAAIVGAGVLGAAAGAGVCAGSAWAQCAVTAQPLVEFNQGVRRGTQRGTVYATAFWDPDGDGPESNWLVIGGRFSHVQGVPAQNIAAWDGERWRSFDANFLGSSPTVRALAVHQGQLIAAGSFDLVGAAASSHVSTGGLIELLPGGWRLFSGRSGPNQLASKELDSLLSDGDSLYVAGNLLVADDDTSTTTPVVRWDGTSYRTMHTPRPQSGRVVAMAMHDGDLHVTGSFTMGGAPGITRVARYDGSAWHHVGSGLALDGLSITSASGMLYIGVEPSSTSEMSVRAWDGSAWSDVGPALGGRAARSLVTLGGAPVVGVGTFGSPTSVPMGVFRLGDSGWEPVEAPLDLGISPGIQVHSLSVNNGELIAAGDCELATGFRAAGGIARWNGERWTSIGDVLNGSVRHLQRDGDGVLLSGSFTSIGGVFSPGIARMAANGIEAIESPITFADQGRECVNSAIRWDDRLALTGNFLIDGAARAGLAIRETSGTWTVPDHGDDWFQGLQAVVADSSLYVLANVAAPPSTLFAVKRVAGGVVDEIASLSSSPTMCEHDGRLIVGGSFASIGGASISTIASFDGVVWEPIGSGLSGSVRSVASHRGNLFAAGDFTISGTGEAATLARWNGDHWSRVDTPTPGTLWFVASTSMGLVVANSTDEYIWLEGRWTKIYGLLRDSSTQLVHYGAAELSGQFVTIGSTRYASRNFGVPMVAALPCEADLNCDGESDILDFLEYLQAFGVCEGGEPGCDEIRADYDQNGEIDIMDVMAFMDAFGAGCQ